jgi:tricorn protease
VSQAGEEVELTLRRDGRVFAVTVRTIADEAPGRYRDWVNLNRALCHQRSAGRIGYLHVPDMGPEGFAEFHRGFLAEYDRHALIVDVRFNGGGNVSALLLEKLARRRLGYDYPRWGAPEPYPPESPRGPLVAITNEWAGSDGDIFSHTFKVLKLGPLVGRWRTTAPTPTSPRRTTPPAWTPSCGRRSRWRSTCWPANPYTLLIFRIGRACNLSYL